MAGCGTCPDSCNCVVTEGARVNVTGDGSAGSPYVITADASPTFVPTSPLGGMLLGNLGPNQGHTPTIDPKIAAAGGLLIGGSGIQIKVDPASTAPISLGAGGLRVDCCAGGSVGVDDTPTVNMLIVGNVISANVIPNTAAGLENQAGGVSVKIQNDPAAIAPAAGIGGLRFTTAGDLTLSENDIMVASGMDARGVGSGAAVNLAGTAPNFGANSFSGVITNSENFPVFVRLSGIMEFTSTTSGAVGTNRIWNQSGILDISAVAGGGADIGTAGIFTVYEVNQNVDAAGVVRVDRGLVDKWAYLPAGASATFRARSQCLRTVSGWTTTTGAGASFQFTNVHLAAWAAKSGGLAI